MSFLNKLFSSKDKNSQEKKNIEEEIPDDFSNVKTRDQYKDYYFFYNYLKKIKLNGKIVIFPLLGTFKSIVFI